MTTVIDEIMKDIAGYLDSENSMEKVKSKLKQHLTTPPTSPAVNGVNELIEKREKDIREVQNSKCPIYMPLGETLWKTIREAQIKTLEMCIKDMSLKQTPFASEEGVQGKCKICGKEGMYLETDNMMCDSCRGINTEVRLKDSQLKEVEMKEEEEKHIHKFYPVGLPYRDGEYIKMTCECGKFIESRVSKF